jgi:hypothetical protein
MAWQLMCKCLGNSCLASLEKITYERGESNLANIIIIIITFIHFVFINTNINQFTSNIMKIEKWKTNQ